VGCGQGAAQDRNGYEKCFQGCLLAYVSRCHLVPGRARLTKKGSAPSDKYTHHSAGCTADDHFLKWRKWVLVGIIGLGFQKTV
jgi:hypothetical protein